MGVAAAEMGLTGLVTRGGDGVNWSRVALLTHGLCGV